MNLQVGVKVLIKNSQNKYLFLRRSQEFAIESGADSWDIPGGRISLDETLYDGLSREVREEIGSTLKGLPKLIAGQDIIKPSKSIHVVRLTYVLVQDISDIKLSREHEGHSWMTLADAKALSLEPYLKEVINSL